MTESLFFEHYTKIPHDVWRWPHFTPREIASKGNGSILINFDALDKLEAARELLGKPMIINSAYRDAKYNRLIGGSPNSMHMQGRAFDIALGKHDKKYLHSILLEAGFTGFGLNYPSFIHADTGRPRTW